VSAHRHSPDVGSERFSFVVLLETELGTEVIVGTQLQTFRNAGYA
jgi:hypothetical protein